MGGKIRLVTPVDNESVLAISLANRHNGTQTPGVRAVFEYTIRTSAIEVP